MTTTSQTEPLAAGAVFQGDWITFGAIDSPALVLHVDAYGSRYAPQYRVTLETAPDVVVSLRLPAIVQLHRDLFLNPPF